MAAFRALLAPLVTLVACAGPTEDVCQLAMEHLAACGITVDEAGMEDCDPELAESILAEDCTVSGKADDGAATLSYPEVVSVDTDMGTCTGTLVGARTVLTAAHCFQSPHDEATVTRQVEGSGGWVSSEVRDIILHEEYEPASLAFLESADIALVRLVDPVDALLPALVTNRVKWLEPIYIVGYGKTSAFEDDGGTKRAGTNHVSLVGPEHFYFDSSLWSDGVTTCYGDSGGPSYVVRGGLRVVAGVHHSGNCVDPLPRIAGDARVDLYVSWIACHADDPTVRVEGGGPARCER